MFRCASLLLLLTLPAAISVQAQISPDIREKFRQLMSTDPEFAKTRYDVELHCLDGSSTSPKCDEMLQARFDNYLRKKRIEALTLSVDSRNALLSELELAFGLAQLGDYVSAGVLPTGANDYMARISTNPNASELVRELAVRLRKSPRANVEDREALLTALRESHARYKQKLAAAPRDVLEWRGGAYLKDGADQEEKYSILEKLLRAQ